MPALPAPGRPRSHDHSAAYPAIDGPVSESVFPARPVPRARPFPGLPLGPAFRRHGAGALIPSRCLSAVLSGKTRKRLEDRRAFRSDELFLSAAGDGAKTAGWPFRCDGGIPDCRIRVRRRSRWRATLTTCIGNRRAAPATILPNIAGPSCMLAGCTATGVRYDPVFSDWWNRIGRIIRAG